MPEMFNAVQRTGSWALAIFASRETPDVLASTVRAALAAVDRGMVVDVLVNGNPGMAQAFADRFGAALATKEGPRLRIWEIAQGDKGHAWNQYIHAIWSGESLAFFIDGYVRPMPSAVRLLGAGVLADSHRLGGSGVPTTGRTAGDMRKNMLARGGFHGNLCCLRGEFIGRMRERGIRIPLGLYRTDSLIGAFLSFDLDPANRGWDASRILVHPDVSWAVDDKQWWRLSDLRAKFKRTLRQARGLLENEAVKQHLTHDRKAPEQLPATAFELLQGWRERQPEAVRAFVRFRPLTRWAWRQLAQPPDWSRATVPPRLVWSSAQEGAAS